MAKTLKLADADKQMDQLAEIQSLQQRLLSAAYDAIGEDDIRDIVQARVQDAKAGDKTALDFVFKYLLGRDGGNVSFHKHETNIITDVATAAKIAAKTKTA